MTAPLDSAATAAAAASAPRAEIRAEVLRGLLASPKTLPPKLFYDDLGARLFEQICLLDEYYLTRTELAILRQHAAEAAALAGPRCVLVEYGSGAGVKIRLLLDAMRQPVAYVPVDVSRNQLQRVAAELTREYPGVAVRPLCADYTTPLQLPPLPPHARRVAFFPGSTIGNFHPTEAAAFLHRIRRLVGPGGALLLGVDRRKDERALHAAYNDRAGVTAAFNLNLLARLNRELDADFDLSRFRHRAFFDARASRIEMHLESLATQTVHVAGATVRFARGETIWTESSYKYDRPALDRLLMVAGFEVERLWTDAQERFWIGFLIAR